MRTQLLWRYSLDAGLCGKNTNQEAIRKLCSPKTVQNQRFYIILLTKKNQVIVLSFWMKAHVGRYLNMDPQRSANPTSLEIFSRCGILWKKHQSRSHQKTLWGVPFPSPKTVQNQRFYIILSTKKNQVIVFEFLDDSSCRKIP